MVCFMGRASANMQKDTQQARFFGRLLKDSDSCYQSNSKQRVSFTHCGPDLLHLAASGLALKPKIQLKIRRYLQTSGGDAEVLLQSFKPLSRFQWGEIVAQLCQMKQI